MLCLAWGKSSYMVMVVDTKQKMVEIWGGGSRKRHQRVGGPLNQGVECRVYVLAESKEYTGIMG